MAAVKKSIPEKPSKPASAEIQGSARPAAHGVAQASAAEISNAKDRPAPKKAKTRARRTRQDRGIETRNRLIDAALDSFGRLGFDGASTREIADKADINIALIKYHFGSKEALHVAVAEHIVSQISERVGPVIVKVNSPESFSSREAARRALDRLIETFVDTILGEEKAEQWARFIVREQMQPTPAFEVIYRFIGTAHEVGSRLVATALGKDAADEDVKLRAFAIMGQVLVFRVAQTLVLRRMEWRTISEAERTRIKRVIISHIDAILDAEADAQ
ncbi:MAG: CerR family C-terminal domain-containing protein [Salaquimonas sp.]|nr:CerR family C-terminal domain-containing protein [Salaquimonas sp.]